MKIKKLLSVLLTVCLVFSVFTVLTLTVPVTASATGTSAEDAILIGKTGKNQIANIMLPVGAKGSGGVTWNDQYVFFKLTFKCKMLSGTQPIIGALRTNYGSGDSSYSEHRWAYNNAIGIAEEKIDEALMSSYDSSTGTFTAIIRAWYNETNYYRNGRWFYITIGNAEHNAASSNEHDWDASFIMSQPELYAYDTASGQTYGGNLAPSFSDGLSFNGTYFFRAQGCAQYDSPYYATVDKWNIDSSPAMIHHITVPSDYNTSSNYNAGNFTQVPETDYIREYYTNSNYPNTYFVKYANSENKAFGIVTDLNKKMIIIDANHEGEADNRTTDGYKPVYNRPANIFLPISFGQYNITGGAPTDGNYLIKVSMRAVRLEGDGYPVLGRIVGKKSVGSGGGSTAFGKMAKNMHLSGYYGTGSHETYTGGDFSYNETTGDFIGWMRVRISDNDYATKWGVNEVITIGNAEHVWQEGTFDTTEFNSSFAISNVKVDVYSCTNPSSGVYSVGSLVQEDVAPGLYAENIDVDSPWAFQFTDSSGASNHSRDLVRANQYFWQADGCVGMVHAANLTACMKGNHTLTHYAATDNTREYYSCATCGKYFADPCGLEAITDISATKQMLILPTTGSGSESVFCTAKLNAFENNQWFKFTCKAKCLGDDAPVVSSLYAVYGGTNACETTDKTSNDGDFSFFESSYDPTTGILTGYMKAWIKDSINKGSRYPFERYNPVSGANCAIVIGNGRYIGNGYTDENHATRFSISEPELYMIDGATTGGDAGLEDAKTKPLTGTNLLAPMTDKTIDLESDYTTSWSSSNNPLGATVGKWFRLGSNKSQVYSSNIPDGYFDVEAVTEKPRMIRLGGYGSNQQALCWQTELTRGTTYQFDIDYRACGGVNALYKPQISNTTSGFENIDYYTDIGATQTDTGTHYTLRFTLPDFAKINTNNFKIYLGQKWPLRRNGTVFFANVSLYQVSGGNLTGSNLITNGDFHLGTPGKVTESTKNDVFSGWEQIQVMTYPGVYLLDIPEGFFTDGADMNLQNVYEFKGGDVYKPQFDFHFAAGKTYRLIYDYYCDDDDTVNAYILSKDNSVTAVKNSRISTNKFEAVYTVTAAADTKQYTDQQSANGSIRFALNGNSYADSFFISNIRLYVVEGGNIVGGNLAMSLNPCLDDKYYNIEFPGEEFEFALAKNDSNCDSQKTNIAIGWVGNLDYNNASTEATYAKVVKTNGHLFDNYSDACKYQYMVDALLECNFEYNPFTDPFSRFYDPKTDGENNVCDLIKLKKNIISNVYSYNISNEQTNGGVYGSVSTVACYGDSITQGMGYESSPQKTYPGRLNTMLGDGYTVVNCGDPGERSFTIMARQGALSLVTSKEITFPAGTSQVQIGNNSDNGFITLKGDHIDLTARLGNERSINTVTVGGNTYEVIMTDFTWSPRSCNIHLKRSNTSSTLTIPAGTAVTFSSYTRQDECDIYLVGANGVYTSANDLVAQYKAMVDKHGSNNFLIVIPFWNTYCDTPFREAFGDHCISFRLSAISDGLAYEGITPTATDEEYIANGEVPPSLLYYPDNPDVHLNAKGYDLMAHLLYEQGQTIGIW